MKLKTGITAIAAGLMFLLLTSLLVMVLWNAVVTDLLNVRAIGFFEAIGLKILCSQLFSHKVHNVSELIKKDK